MNGIEVFFRLCPFKPANNNDKNIITYHPGKQPTFKIIHPKLSIQDEEQVVSYNISDIQEVFQSNINNLTVYKKIIHQVTISHNSPLVHRRRKPKTSINSSRLHDCRVMQKNEIHKTKLWVNVDILTFHPFRNTFPMAVRSQVVTGLPDVLER